MAIILEQLQINLNIFWLQTTELIDFTYVSFQEKKQFCHIPKQII